MNLFLKFAKNNTGYSVKNLFVIIIVIIGCLLLLVPLVSLTIEAIYMHTIATDLMGMSAYITSVSALFGIAGYTKVSSEKYERPFTPPHHGLPNGDESEIVESEEIANE